MRTSATPIFNANEALSVALEDFVAGRPNVEYEFLAYHRLGQRKCYSGLPAKSSVTP